MNTSNALFAQLSKPLLLLIFRYRLFYISSLSCLMDLGFKWPLLPLGPLGWNSKNYCENLERFPNQTVRVMEVSYCWLIVFFMVEFMNHAGWSFYIYKWPHHKNQKATRHGRGRETQVPLIDFSWDRWPSMCVVSQSIRGGHCVCPPCHIGVVMTKLEGDEAVIYNT